MFQSYIKLTAPFFSSEQKSKVFVLFCVLRRKNVFVNRFIYNDLQPINKIFFYTLNKFKDLK